MRKKVSLKITKQGGGNVYVDDDVHSPNRRDIFFQVQLTEIFLFSCQMFSKYSLRRAEQAFFTHVERNSRNVTAASKTVDPSIKSTGPVKSPKLGKRKPSNGKLILQSNESSKYSNSNVLPSPTQYSLQTKLSLTQGSVLKRRKRLRKVPQRWKWSRNVRMVSLVILIR